MDKSDGGDHNEPLNYRKIAAKLRTGGKDLDMLKEEGNDVCEGQVSLLQLEIAFDSKLKEMASIRVADDPENDLTKAQRGLFYSVRSLVVFIYFMVTPYCQSPGWCL